MATLAGGLDATKSGILSKFEICFAGSDALTGVLVPGGGVEEEETHGHNQRQAEGTRGALGAPRGEAAADIRGSYNRRGTGNSIIRPISSQSSSSSSSSEEEREGLLVQFLRHWVRLDRRQQSKAYRKVEAEFRWLLDFSLLCDKLAEGVENLKGDLRFLEVQKKEVLFKTDTLHSTCDSILSSKANSERIIRSLEERLVYFEKLPSLRARLLALSSPQSPSASGNNVAGNSTGVGEVASAGRSSEGLAEVEGMRRLLDETDEGAAYVQSHSHFSDSAAALSGYERLRIEACGLIRQSVLQALDRCERQIDAKLKSGRSNMSKPHTLEPSLFYVRYRAAGLSVKPLTAMIHERARADVSQVYVDSLAQMEALYVANRTRIVIPPLKRQLEAILHDKERISAEGRPTAARHATTYVFSVSQLELTTFASFFLLGQPDREALRTLLTAIGELFSDFIRSTILECDSVDELRQIGDCLALDVLEPQSHTRRGAELAPLLSFVHQLHRDVQERLIFKTETLILDDIRRFTPTAEELDYPKRLFDNLGAQPRLATSGWFPPLTTALTCLSTVHGILEPSTFQGVGQEAVDSCLQSLIHAASLIKQQKPTSLDSQLFLIKHLLILREQVNIFQVRLVQQERIFDFSRLRHRLWQTLTLKRNPLRTNTSALKSTAALFKYFAPEVQELKTDTKQDLEAAIRLTCEAFVAECSASVVLPLIRLTSQVSESVSRQISQRNSLTIGNGLSPPGVGTNPIRLESDQQEQPPSPSATASGAVEVDDPHPNLPEVQEDIPHEVREMDGSSRFSEGQRVASRDDHGTESGGGLHQGRAAAGGRSGQQPQSSVLLSKESKVGRRRGGGDDEARSSSFVSGLLPREELKALPFLSEDALSKTSEKFWRAICKEIPKILHGMSLYFNGPPQSFLSVPEPYASLYLDQSPVEDPPPKKLSSAGETPEGPVTPPHSDASGPDVHTDMSYDHHRQSSEMEERRREGVPRNPSTPLGILFRPLYLSINEAARQIHRLLQSDIGLPDETLSRIGWRHPDEVDAFLCTLFSEASRGGPPPPGTTTHLQTPNSGKSARLLGADGLPFSDTPLVIPEDTLS